MATASAPAKGGKKLQRMSEVPTKVQTLSLDAESLYDQVELSIMKIVKIKRNITHEIVLKRRL
jgi:hypothetical protein